MVTAIRVTSYHLNEFQRQRHIADGSSPFHIDTAIVFNVREAAVPCA